MIKKAISAILFLGIAATAENELPGGEEPTRQLASTRLQASMVYARKSYTAYKKKQQVDQKEARVRAVAYKKYRLAKHAATIANITKFRKSEKAKM